MKITGFRKTSLIDYPGYISTIVFTQGCNFSCPYCHNPELIPIESERPVMDTGYFRDFLESRKHLIDGVVITGGEPTLQKDLVQFISLIKEFGLRVKLDTNGSNYQLLEKLFTNKLVDYVAMDLKNRFEKYDQFSESKYILEDVINSTELIKDSGVDYEFRTTVVPGLHNKQDIEVISRSMEGAGKYVIQNFRSGTTYDPDFQDLKGFPEVTLAEFKGIAERYFNEVEIRN